MSKTKIYSNISCVGEVLVIIGAMVWVTGTDVANYVYAAGTTIFAIGRLNEEKENGS